MKSFRDHLYEQNKHREATPEELLKSVDRHIKYGTKLGFRHYAVEKLVKTAKNGVKHVQYSKAKPYEKDGKVYVKHHGREEEIVASAMEMPDYDRPIIHDHRIKGLR